MLCISCTEGNARSNDAEDGFSPEWWRHMRFAAEEAKRAGMSLEINISNGYVAGGSWIEAAHAMKRVVTADTIITHCGRQRFSIPMISRRDGYVDDIAVLALPYNNDGMMRHITAQYPAKGKVRNGAMQIPGESDSFIGAGCNKMPDIGVLQASDDSITWLNVVTLEQKRFVVMDMVTGVPQRDVRVRWNKTQQTHSIWDGSFYMKDVKDDVEIFKPGYMTRIMKPEELTDTIGILPTFNKLSEVVVIGKYKPPKFGWTLKPLTKEEIAAMNYNRRGINLDVIGGIKKLLTHKKRKRRKRTKEIIAEY